MMWLKMQSAEWATKQKKGTNENGKDLRWVIYI